MSWTRARTGRRPARGPRGSGVAARCRRRPVGPLPERARRAAGDPDSYRLGSMPTPQQRVAARAGPEPGDHVQDLDAGQRRLGRQAGARAPPPGAPPAGRGWPVHGGRAVGVQGGAAGGSHDQTRLGRGGCPGWCRRRFTWSEPVGVRGGRRPRPGSSGAALYPGTSLPSSAAAPVGVVGLRARSAWRAAEEIVAAQLRGGRGPDLGVAGGRALLVLAEQRLAELLARPQAGVADGEVAWARWIWAA